MKKINKQKFETNYGLVGQCALIILCCGFLFSSIHAEEQEWRTIYHEDFSGSPVLDLNGSAPLVRPGNETWITNRWAADGTLTKIPTEGQIYRNAHLAFVPEEGMLYRLTVSMGLEGNGQLYAGFAQAANTGSSFPNVALGTTGFFRVIGPDHPNQKNQVWAHRDYDGNNLLMGTMGAQNPLYAMELDTRGKNWTVEWFINGNSVRLFEYGPESGSIWGNENPEINYISFGVSYIAAPPEESSWTATMENFKLEALIIPEARAYALLFGAGIFLLVLLRRSLSGKSS